MSDPDSRTPARFSSAGEQHLSSTQATTQISNIAVAATAASESESYGTPRLLEDTRSQPQDHISSAANTGTEEGETRQVQTYILQLEIEGGGGSDPTIRRTVLDRDDLEARVRFMLLQQNIAPVADKVIASLNRTIVRVNKTYDINIPRLDKYSLTIRSINRLDRIPMQLAPAKTWLLLGCVNVTFQDMPLRPIKLSGVVKRLVKEIRERLGDNLERKNQDLAQKSKQFRALQEEALRIDSSIAAGVEPWAEMFNRSMSRVQTPMLVPQLAGFLPNPEDVGQDVRYPHDDHYRGNDGALIPLWSDGRDRTAQELVQEAFEAEAPWPTMRGALSRRKKARTVHEQLESAASKVDHGENKRMAAQRLNGTLAKLGHGDYKIIGFRTILRGVVVPRWIDGKDRTALSLLRQLDLLR